LSLTNSRHGAFEAARTIVTNAYHITGIDPWMGLGDWDKIVLPRKSIPKYRDEKRNLYGDSALTRMGLLPIDWRSPRPQG
jgi:hypothetical protein